jgi:hypothetical protein
MRMGPRSGPVRVAQTEFFGLTRRELTVTPRERVEESRDFECAFAGVKVVVTAHRRRGQVKVWLVAEAFPDCRADVLPYEGVGEFGFDLPGAAVDADQRFEHDEHEPRVLATSTTMSMFGGRDDCRERVGRGVGEDRVDALERADRTDTHRQLLVLSLGPVPSHDPRCTIKTAHTQQPGYRIDPACLVEQ